MNDDVQTPPPGPTLDELRDRFEREGEEWDNDDPIQVVELA